VFKQKECFERIFKSEDGKIILGALIGDCVNELGAFTPDPYVLAFNEGKRALLMLILKLSSLSFENYVKMYDWDKRFEEKEEARAAFMGDI
jgi:hypothetical protein